MSCEAAIVTLIKWHINAGLILSLFSSNLHQFHIDLKQEKSLNALKLNINAINSLKALL